MKSINSIVWSHHFTKRGGLCL